MRILICLLTFIAALSIAHASPVYEVVADFERPPGSPVAPLVLASDGNFYGTTSEGGKHDLGSVFKMSPAGAVTVLVHFDGTNGATPLAGLIVGADGALYGTASAGGTSSLGTVFKVTTAGTLTTLVNFTGTSGVAKGAVPAGELHLASDGNFYGTTQAGGASDFGTVFRMTPVGAVTTLREFTGTSGASKGAEPRGKLATDVAGTTLFGICARGGAGDFGTIFKITTAGTFTLLKEFTGGSGNTKGETPAGGLIRATDGNFYGVTESGGADGLGVIFKITSGGSFTTLHDGAAADGGDFAGALFQAPDGNLYGTAANGGANDLGVIFQITTGGAYTMVSEFGGNVGAAPRAALVPGVDGALYGTAAARGAGDLGALFKIATAGALTMLAQFTNVEGWSPSGGLTVAADGNLLVTFTEGGVGGWGALSKVTTSGAATPLVSFTGTSGAVRGAEPVGAVHENAFGDIYGLTRRGATADGGTAFRFSAIGVFTSLSGFGSATGQFPEDNLIAGPDGFFYATASEGGAFGNGTIFKMNAVGTRNLLVSFTGNAGTAPGTTPVAALAPGDDGEFFGTTAEGGANDKGTLFRVTTAGVFTPLVEFSGADGATPLGALVRGPNGDFYGTTTGGGTSNVGTVFRLTTAGARTTIVEFNGTNGAMPAGTLLAAPDGMLYGTTSAGGANGFGTVFRISPAGALSPLFHFSGIAGANPGSGGPGAPVFGSDGMLYAATPDGGSRGGGALVRIRNLGPHAGTQFMSALTTTSATLNALVVTGGEATTVLFEYGLSLALGSTTAAQNVGPAGSPAHIAHNLTGLASGQTFYYRAKAVNASGTSLGLTRSFTVPTAFGAWKYAMLGNTNAPDLSDDDSDGLALLHEYALSLSPLAMDIPPAPELRPYPEGQRLGVVFTRDPVRNDITIEVQATDDVAGPWTTVATSVNGAPMTGAGYFAGEIEGSAARQIEVRDIINATDATQRFLRLRITH